MPTLAPKFPQKNALSLVARLNCIKKLNNLPPKLATKRISPGCTRNIASIFYSSRCCCCIGLINCKFDIREETQGWFTTVGLKNPTPPPSPLPKQTTANAPRPLTTTNCSNLFLPHPHPKAPKPNSSPQPNSSPPFIRASDAVSAALTSDLGGPGDEMGCQYARWPERTCAPDRC